MAKIIQEADYIRKRKRKYRTYTLISLGIMMTIFVLGLIINSGSRNNLFTLVAILFTLVVAQYGVQYISIIKYKDGEAKVAEELKSLPDSYIVWNSALFGDQLGMAFFDHIIITDKKIFFIVDKYYKEYDKNLQHMKRIVENKGLKDETVFIEKYKEDFSKLVNTWRQDKIQDVKKQAEYIEALKSAAI